MRLNLNLNLKKLLLKYFPYLMIAWLFNKAAQCYRLTAGANMIANLLGVVAGLGVVIKRNPLPSLFPRDLLVGIVGAAIAISRHRTQRNSGMDGNTEARAGVLRRI